MYQLEDNTHLCESDKCPPDVQSIKMRCHPPSWTIATVLSKSNLASSNTSVGSRDLPERIARRWYLTVIVMLYIGLITSFALNVSLLLNNYPEPSPSGLSHDKHQLSLDETELSKGINWIIIYQTNQCTFNTEASSYTYYILVLHSRETQGRELQTI